MASAPTDCYPTWHPRFASMQGGPADQLILNSGCRPDDTGEIRCAPESMRASAEKQLQASGFWPREKPLDLNTYTLARYMHSEIGSGTVEERVAVGEVGVNQAKRRGQDINGLLLFTQPTKLYGEINVRGGRNTGRFAATSRDPSVLTALLADLVISGKSENINLGADDQDGLEFQRFFPVPMNRILSEANSGKYWVGPIPGVDHWKTTQFRTFGFKPTSFEGRQLIERARQFFGNPTYVNGIVSQSLRPIWPANLPICGNVPGETAQTSGRQFLVGVLIVGSLIGLAWGALRIARNIAHGSRTLGGGDDDFGYEIYDNRKWRRRERRR